MKISTRQLIIFYCIYSFSIKFLSLPALLSQTAGKDAWIAAVVGTIAELVLLFLVLLWIKNCDKTIYQSLVIQNKNKFIKYTTIMLAKFVMLIFLAIFFYQILILTDQTYGLLNNNLFDKVPYYLFSIPLFLLGVFFCLSPTQAIFRSGEIFFIFIVIGIVLSVFPAVTSIKPDEVLPVFDRGAKPIFMAVLKNIIYFESVLFILMFKGEIQISKHFIKKFMTVAMILAIFFVFFVFMFYSLFGPLAPTKNIAVTNFTIHSIYITATGRLDWLLVIMWLLLILLRFGITFLASFKCLKFISNEMFSKFSKNEGLITLIVCTALAIFVYCIYTFVEVVYA